MKTVNVVESIQGMTSTKLRKKASKLGIKNYTKYSKSDLLKIVLGKITPISTVGKSLSQIAEEELNAIMNSDNINKSEKFRMLFQRGGTPGDVSKLFGAHYSFVYGVKQRMEA